MSESILPFGMFFEEPALEAEDGPTVFYDEKLEVSCVKTAEGKAIPLVEADVQLSGTQTSTSVKREQTDTDPQDDSARVFAALGTETVTEVRQESTDRDPSPRPQSEPSRRPLGTETATKAKSESTQIDYQ